MASKKVVALTFLLLFLFGLYAVVHSNPMNSNLTSYTIGSHTVKPLKVLFVSAPFPGHTNALLALGEELVRRGHNVSFCSTDSWDNLIEKVMERRMKYLSAGIVIDYESKRANIHKVLKSMFSSNPWMVYKALMTVIEWNQEIVSPIIDYLINNDVTQWDIVITDYLLINSVPCIARYHNVSVIGVFNRPIHNINHPPWPYPSITSGKTDNIMFLDRLSNIPSRFIGLLIGKFFFYSSPTVNKLCNKVFHWGPLEGWEYPAIVRTVIGFEYPRTISPLTEYVGPILSKLNKPLPTDLSKWIQDKEDNSVIYISMGSIANTNYDLVVAFVNSTNSTTYSVVWSLNELHQHFLDDMKLDSHKYVISSWTPQVTLLQHKSISMAILHGGSNGVHEALYYGVPLIVIPQFGDQFDWAAMVEHSGVGLQIKPHQVSSQTIKKSIKTIESGEYHKKAQKMSQIMKKAGGVDKAADLVEFYVNVGYDHLIPGPVKYKWSWIQYYNIDVHVTLLCILLIIMYCIVKVCKCCCRCCSKEKLKKE